VDRQNTSASSIQANIALPRTCDELAHFPPRPQSAPSALRDLPQFGHIADGDDLRARVEAIVYQARAQRAADLGEIIGVALLAISDGLARIIRFASRNVRDLPELRVRRMPARK
jgi:hypothetical protein